ncbi:angiopoietin-4-like isoform X1 [Eriocheir sinensis]|uniref:angiopoietin-4-like isoform X1 n=1 Tax=Eriocheir sinensis TaxID=95602 RepID=UPI0021C713CE|nr:angiopoietin-4-like isoform X1 [Eriocheir sinensis]XP_050709805.1 angiopoietin-4-like isoform X1 [Eriocheir sinensis]XP_050709806.1 angiopoietin-4-like isoform X1 [Eriocheir sinensis]XP_050709807.1 angiopoietin-4-like isoform X1 [Eriocheir sinensis]XP_050709808.1 angiopoietin-4-like isoform X1 [Eriocheir sinensis]
MANHSIMLVMVVVMVVMVVVEAASTGRRKNNNNNNNNSSITVPSDLLLRLMDVTRSLHQLMPLQRLSEDDAATTATTTATSGLQGTSGEERILTLALTQHALLQHRMEDLLTQTGRCEAQVEALKEDKEELKREIAHLKERVRQILSQKNGSPPPQPKKLSGKTDCNCSASTTIPTTTATTTTTTTTAVPSSSGLSATAATGVSATTGSEAITTTAATTTTTTTTATTTGTKPVVILGSGVRVKDCAGHQLAGASENGVYEIYPSECRAVKVYCDLETAGGGWTIFLNRQEFKDREKPQENFTRNWNDYKNGFGDVTGEYWLGNKILHILTSREPHILRVDAEDFEGSRRWGEWRRFKVENESQGYKLVSLLYDTNSTLGDGLLWHSGMQFSTIDRDNDKHKGSCAHEYKGGFWYNVCHNANPTGLLVNSDQFDSVGWVYWSPKRYKWASLRYLSLKLRPKSFGGSGGAHTDGPGDCSGGGGGGKEEEEEEEEDEEEEV